MGRKEWWVSKYLKNASDNCENLLGMWLWGFFKSSWFSSHRFHSEKTYFSVWRLISFHPAVSASISAREKQRKDKEATDGSERIEGSFFVWGFRSCVFLYFEQGRGLLCWAAWPITPGPRHGAPAIPLSLLAQGLTHPSYHEYVFR